MRQQILPFLRALYHHGKDNYSGFMFLLGIVALVLWMFVPSGWAKLSGFLGLVAVLTSTVIATFFAWYEALPPDRLVDLRIEPRATTLAPVRIAPTGRLEEPCTLILELEVRNAGTESVIIDAIDVLQFDDHPAYPLHPKHQNPDCLFASECTDTRAICKERLPNQEVSFPFSVEPGKIILDWQVQAKIHVLPEKDISSIEFARRLSTLENFRLQLCYRWRTAESKPGAGDSNPVPPIDGTFKDLKRHLLIHWRANNLIH